MSKTRSRHPFPSDGADKQSHRHLKPLKRGRDIRDELIGQSNRLYREDFMPPKTWHNDA